ncbi:hypothetical protein BRADI_3g26938v3, partial [Brachypodium distachyon]
MADEVGSQGRRRSRRTSRQRRGASGGPFHRTPSGGAVGEGRSGGGDGRWRWRRPCSGRGRGTDIGQLGEGGNKTANRFRWSTGRRAGGAVRRTTGRRAGGAWGEEGRGPPLGERRGAGRRGPRRGGGLVALVERRDAGRRSGRGEAWVAAREEERRGASWPSTGRGSGRGGASRPSMGRGETVGVAGAEDRQGASPPCSSGSGLRRADWERRRRGTGGGGCRAARISGVPAPVRLAPGRRRGVGG